MITALILVVVFVGLPLLCWKDPAGHYEAELKARLDKKARL